MEKISIVKPNVTKINLRGKSPELLGSKCIKLLSHWNKNIFKTIPAEESSKVTREVNISLSHLAWYFIKMIVLLCGWSVWNSSFTCFAYYCLLNYVVFVFHIFFYICVPKTNSNRWVKVSLSCIFGTINKKENKFFVKGMLVKHMVTSYFLIGRIYYRCIWLIDTSKKYFW